MGLFDSFKGGEPGPDEISYADLAAAMQAKSCILIDVREPQEFSSSHVAGSENMPLSRFDAAQLPTDKPLVLICRSGARSAQALSKARAAGRTDIRHYRGGVMGWTSAGGRLA